MDIVAIQHISLMGGEGKKNNNSSNLKFIRKKKTKQKIKGKRCISSVRLMIAEPN